MERQYLPFIILGGLFLLAYIWVEAIDPWLARKKFKGKDIDELYENHNDIVEELGNLAEAQKKTNEHLEKLIDVLGKGKK